MILNVIYVLLLCLSCKLPLVANSVAPRTTKPKIVIGIVVDQMRWDYLYKFQNRFQDSGAFRTLLEEGFECKNTHINYVPTVTAAGHACIYTGTTPALNGIVGNNWYNADKGKKVYCTESEKYKTSPANMWVTTITDELRIQSNFQSRTFGIAIKDRGAVLPVGHSANGAFWYDSKTGDWVSSSYYYNDMPRWVTQFNKDKKVDTYYARNWSTLYDISTYTKQQKDKNDYEYNPFKQNQFPYSLQQYQGKDYSKISSTPWGNSLTIDFAKTLIEKEKLGSNKNITDFLAISFSSTDYVGHAFGPNSVEIEDTYLRLDKELGELLKYLDQRFGKGQYFIFLSSDHGVSHIPQFAMQHHLPGGVINNTDIVKHINEYASTQLGISDLVVAFENAQIYLNHNELHKKKLSLGELIPKIKEWLYKHYDNISFVLDNHQLALETAPTSIKEKIRNGYHPLRSGDISIIFKSGMLHQWTPHKGTTHFSPYTYDTHIPLIFFGWGVNKGSSLRLTRITDIAPTIATLLHIQMPSAATGRIIEAAIKQ